MNCNILKRSKQLMQITRVFILILTTLIQAQFVHSCEEEERVGLLHLKSYFKSHYHFRPGDSPFEERWSTSPFEDHVGYNCFAWRRIDCNPSTGRVIRLDFKNLLWRDDGNYDDTKVWLFNVTLLRPFTQLIHLDLSWNHYINGLVENDGSARISTLKSLQTLVLDQNQLQSNYVSFGALTSLRTLSLYNCGLNNHSVTALDRT